MITAEIQNMSTKDRIILMEEIWDTLRREEDSIDSPAWHKEVLDERRCQIEDGKAKYLTIQELKKRKK